MALFRKSKEDKNKAVQGGKGVEMKVSGPEGQRPGGEKQKTDDKKVKDSKKVEEKVVIKKETDSKSIKAEKKQKNKKGSKANNKSFKERMVVRVIIAGIVNALVVIFLVIILGKLSEKALDLKNLKSSISLAEQSADINFADLEIKSNKEVADKLLALYPDDVGLVNFVQEVEKLKNEGTVANFSFANQVPVRDKTKYLGIPVAIELVGTWEQIGNDLEKLQKLPYLLRPVSVQVSERGEDDIVLMKYGGFLYVDKSLE